MFLGSDAMSSLQKSIVQKNNRPKAVRLVST